MMPPSKPYNPPAPDRLQTVYIDAHIAVCDKPSGLLSVPGRGPEKSVCAISILEQRHGPMRTVHRLDMDTSGVMVFARTAEAQRTLSQQFEARRVSKMYEALVEGHMPDDSGCVDKAIAKFSLNRPLRHLDPDGREAITFWSVIDRTEKATRVELVPKTGRSHQLRLHMASLSHPILGDVFYGDPRSAERLCLHAKSIAFSHPGSDETVEFIAPVPF